MSWGLPVFLTCEKRDTCNLRPDNCNDSSFTWLHDMCQSDLTLNITNWFLFIPNKLKVLSFWHYQQYAFSASLASCIAKEWFKSLSYTLTPYNASCLEPFLLNSLSLFLNQIKWSRHLNLSLYQEIGPKLRKFWTQYRCKINNNLSFIIIRERSFSRIVHFIGCRGGRTHLAR